MRSSSTSIFLLATALATLAGPASTLAAPKKAPARKPAAKAAPKPGGPIVLGTTQLPGDFGKFGTTYTVGKDNPLNFTLDSAEYRVDRFTIGGETWVPKVDEKLLVLHYTVQNPTRGEQSLGWNSFRFTAVDSQDTNHEYIQNTIRTGTEKEALGMSLKPAQKLAVTTMIVVPGEGVIPKLIVARGGDAPVIRYDLRGKVTPIPAPFADPADSTGATRMKDVPATAGTYMPTGTFDIKLDNIAFTKEKLNGETPGEGKRFLTAIFSIKNATQAKRGYGWNTLKPLLRDADGEKVEYNQNALKASRDEVAGGSLEPAEEARIRYYFELPENLGAKTLSIGENDGHVLVYDISSAS